MGKIYGVHDSYCDLVSPTGGGPGVTKFCTCDSGKKASIELKEEAERDLRAKEYADNRINDILKNSAQPLPSEMIKAWHQSMVERWKIDNPRVVVSAPVTDVNRYEEARAYADNCLRKITGELPSVAFDKIQLEKLHSHLLQHWLNAHPAGAVEDAPSATDAASGSHSPDGAAHVPKADHSKPKPFQFFVQQFPLGLRAISKHMEDGCKDPGHVFLGWQEVENGYERYSDAMLRHLVEEVVGTVTDIDRMEGASRSDLWERQAIAVAANTMIRLELLLRKRRNLNLDASDRA